MSFGPSIIEKSKKFLSDKTTLSLQSLRSLQLNLSNVVPNGIVAFTFIRNVIAFSSCTSKFLFSIIFFLLFPTGILFKSKLSVFIVSLNFVFKARSFILSSSLKTKFA